MHGDNSPSQFSAKETEEETLGAIGRARESLGPSSITIPVSSTPPSPTQAAPLEEPFITSITWDASISVHLEVISWEQSQKSPGPFWWGHAAGASQGHGTSGAPMSEGEGQFRSRLPESLKHQAILKDS